MIANIHTAADIVTQTDQAVECFLIDNLTKHYPTFSFIGEESYEASDPLTETPTFIFDPIDGTSNFVHGFPAVCVSIGLTVNKKPMVGVVYNPFHDELWSGVKGHGAFTQKGSGPIRRLPLTKRPMGDFSSACIGIEFGSDREGANFELNLKVFSTLARTRRTGGRFVNSLRCTGSAAITICRVAAGEQEAFWECGSWAWDVAAAWCILEEAGGMMVDGHPGSWEPPVDNRRYLAIRPATDKEGQRRFVEEFWAVIGDERTSYGPL
jgi:myo-inositol-1(or 4)-monophosphatase